jgi:hypothetical protein
MRRVTRVSVLDGADVEVVPFSLPASRSPETEERNRRARNRVQYGRVYPKPLRLNRRSRQSIPRSTVQVPFEVESHHAVIHLRELEIFCLAGVGNVGNVGNVGGSAVVPELMSCDPRRELFDVGLYFG